MASFLTRIRRAFYGTTAIGRADIPVRIQPGGEVTTSPLAGFVAGRQGTGTKVAAAYGHPDALLPPTEIQRLFEGEWVPVTSSWIAAFQYRMLNPTQGSLFARLIKGKEYGGSTIISPAELAALASAPSKGHTLNQLWRRARP